MNLDYYKAIITSHYPELKSAHFVLHAKGWDSVAVDVNNDLIFKFPRDGDDTEPKREASILNVLRGKTVLPIPYLILIESPVLFSVHKKIQGDHVLSSDYDLLSNTARAQLAKDIAGFYADIHAIDIDVMRQAGAKSLDTWPKADKLHQRIQPFLSTEQLDKTRTILEQWKRLKPDPYGDVFGFFDGHGWNMAFDYTLQKLNGIYDFGDAGIGELHQEFIYTNFISTELTNDVISGYERLTGKSIDRNRVNTLWGSLLLTELADMGNDPAHSESVKVNAMRWLDVIE